MSASWDELSARMGRNAKPHALIYAVLIDNDLTDPEEIAIGFEDAWVSCEWPGRAAEPTLWMSVLNEALDTDSEYLLGTEIRPKSELPDSVTLYRGAAEDAAQGMSWTDDLDRAEWFANRFGGRHGAKVYTVEAYPEMVLARFDRRGESEWVLDPDLLPDPEDMLEGG